MASWRDREPFRSALAEPGETVVMCQPRTIVTLARARATWESVHLELRTLPPQPGFEPPGLPADRGWPLVPITRAALADWAKQLDARRRYYHLPVVIEPGEREPDERWRLRVVVRFCPPTRGGEQEER